ncbi:hypothetical protein [Saccharothrix deserti]|uniref:hypothetical protein n=1 Tax=Saccharothrix deserti TaxID=2593674 RepID=UPI00131CDBC5|nr:hypothetical protein [Saccharothrix deserti]
MTDPDHRFDVGIGQRSDDAPPAAVAVGLLADPGLPATLTDRLRDALPERLRDGVTDEVAWTVDTVHEPFEAMYPDYSPLIDKAREHVRGTVWDLVVCVTDQPMQDDSTVVVASLHTADRVSVISLPALGGWRLRRRLSATVVAIIGYFTAQTHDPREPVAISELRRRLSSRTTCVLGAEPGSPHLDAHADAHADSRVEVVRPFRRALPRLLAGMVRVNRPWRLLRGLSRALAGALTGIAFGVLYSTIWTLGTSLGPLRLAGVTVAAVAAMTVWVIVGHELWERGRRTDGGGRDPRVRLRNASTLVTVTVGTVAFFLAMLTIALAAVALVIPPSYLAGTLGHPVGPSHYLVLALMASVLGTIAGAVGSGLEDDTTVREATYGYREQQRRRRVEGVADSGTTATSRYRRD